MTTTTKFSRRKVKGMKSVTITFKLPDAQDEFEDYLKGPSALRALRQLDETLRAKVKHSDEDHEWASLLHEIIADEETDLLW